MRKILIYVLCFVLIVSALVGAFSIGKTVGSNSGKLARIENLIEFFFPMEYDEKKMEDMAAKFMVMALEDPYSEYLTEEESIIFSEAMEGAYKGIGITMFYDEETGYVTVTEVAEDSPADVAGIEAGDLLLYVDDIEFTYENYDRVFYYIKGISEEAPEDETEMKIVVKRDNNELEFGVKRTKLSYNAVDMEEEDGILHIVLKEFSETSAADFEEKIASFDDVKGIILDIRDNGGGELESLIRIAEQLLPEGMLLITEDASENRCEYKIEDNEYYDVPLAVLVNENTASASEVLAAAIKERERGILIGKTTYGKGLVQGVLPLGDGSMLKLTIEKYYTAGGNYINEIGVVPDIEADGDELDKAKEYISEKNKKGL
ncbi:MAG: S41 family peptidase [Clostridia bacterium]|nr:S41 family peptidase [Clostridia bacterium]